MGIPGAKKNALNLSVQAASAALPQNCQTTKWILGPPLMGVNVTLVTREKVPLKWGIAAEFDRNHSVWEDCSGPSRIAEESRSVLLPGLAPVPRGPDFALAGGQFAVLGITEFKVNN